MPADAQLAAAALADQADALETAAILERRISDQAKADHKARLLQTAPGVGPLSAHATVATLPDPSVFDSGRDFAAWLGLTPRLEGTGGKQWTGRITKQGNQPLRRLLVLGATAWLRHVKAHPEKGSPWLRSMLARKPIKLVAVAQAARILWAMLRDDQPYRAPAIG